MEGFFDSKLDYFARFKEIPHTMLIKKKKFHIKIKFSTVKFLLFFI